MSYQMPATVVQRDEPRLDGSVLFTVEFLGDAGEPPARRQFVWGSDDTKLTMRAWATEQRRQLNGKRGSSAVVVGETLAAVAPTVPTQAELDKATWLSKLQRYRTLAGLSFVGQAATDLSALKTDLETTYLTGYL